MMRIYYLRIIPINPKDRLMLKIKIENYNL